MTPRGGSNRHGIHEYLASVWKGTIRRLVGHAKQIFILLCGPLAPQSKRGGWLVSQGECARIKTGEDNRQVAQWAIQHALVWRPRRQWPSCDARLGI